MKLWLRRFAKLAAGICAVLVGGLLALYLLFLGAGISLAVIRPAIETALEEKFDHRIDFRLEDVRILRVRRGERDDNLLHFRLSGIQVFDATGVRILALPALSLYPTLLDIRRGTIVPRRADIAHLEIEIFRSATGGLSLMPADDAWARRHPGSGNASGNVSGAAVLPLSGELPDGDGAERLALRDTLGPFLDSPRPVLAHIVEKVTGAIGRFGSIIPRGSHFTISNARVTIIDEVTGEELTLDRLVFDIEQGDQTIATQISGQLVGGSGAAEFTIDTNISGGRGVSAQLAFSRLQAADLIRISGLPLPRYASDMVLTGTIDMTIDPRGDLHRCEVIIASGDEGVAGLTTQIPAQQEPIGAIQKQAEADELYLEMSYDRPAATLVITRLDVKSALIAGDFRGALHLPGLHDIDATTISPPGIRLEGSGVTLTFGAAIFEKPLAFRSVALSSSWDWKANELHFTDVSGAAPEGMLRGDITLRLSADENVSMGVLADVGIDGTLSHAEVLHYWPVFFAKDPRNWVERNIISGNAANIAFKMDLPRGAVRVRTPLQDEMMRLTFDVSEVVSTYIPSMSPLENVNGRGIVGGNSFRLEARNGRVGAARFHEGVVNFPWFFPAPIGEFGATLTGDTKDILAVINEPPLSLITKTGLSPEMFSGESAFTFTLSRPMQPGTGLSEYKFGGEGRFVEVELSDMPIFGDLVLSDGMIKLYNDRISVKSHALLQNIKTMIDWERKFDTQGSTRYAFTGSVNILDADNIGLPSRDFFREGQVDYEVLLTQSLGELEKSVIRADFEAAEISIDEIGYKKELNAPARAMIWINRFKDGLTIPSSAGSPVAGDWLADFSIREGSRFAIEGEAVLSEDGMIRFADLSELRIKNRLDAALRVSRTKTDQILIDVSGDYLRLDNLLERLSGADSPADTATGDAVVAVSGGSVAQIETPPYKVDAAFRVVEMRNDIEMRDVDLSGLFNSRGLVALSLVGAYQEESYLKIDIGPSKKISGRSINISTDDFGKTWSSLFDSKALEGGRGDITATTLANGTTIGALEVSATRLHDTPLIARLLSSASVQGLSDLLRNEGIELDKIKTDLEISDGIVAVKQARATGPSVGVSIDGDIDLSAGRYDLSGALAPAYQVNSFLGDLPGIGELLVSREGEGVVAFSYSVKGAVEEPVITVNALSLLTPGVLRRIFEPLSRQRRATTDEILNEAISVSESLAQSADIEARDLDSHPLPPVQKPAAAPVIPSE